MLAFNVNVCRRTGLLAINQNELNSLTLGSNCWRTLRRQLRTCTSAAEERIVGDSGDSKGFPKDDPLPPREDPMVQMFGAGMLEMNFGRQCLIIDLFATGQEQGCFLQIVPREPMGLQETKLSLRGLAAGVGPMGHGPSWSPVGSINWLQNQS